MNFMNNVIKYVNEKIKYEKIILLRLGLIRGCVYHEISIEY